MSVEHPGGDGVGRAIALVTREAAAGARDGLLMPLSLAKSAHERWGIKGVIGALGITALYAMPSLLLAWDIPRGVLLAALSFPTGGLLNRLALNRLEKLL